MVVLFIYVLLLGYSFNVIFHHGIWDWRGQSNTLEFDKTVPEMLDDFRVTTQNCSDESAVAQLFWFGGIILVAVHRLGEIYCISIMVRVLP